MVALRKSPAPFAPLPLPEACPHCGAVVLLRAWEGRCFASCQGPDCRFGFDADRKGRPAHPCPSCPRGRLRTTPKGRVCADCGKWDNTEEGRPSQGPCPRCRTGKLRVLKGEYGYFVGCSDPVCGLTYTCDETGRPEGGRCKFCQGPVRKTRAGGLLCVACERWQRPKPVPASAPRPPAAPCPTCGQTLRPVWTRRQRWVHRCDPCGRWHPVAGGPTP